MTRAYDSAFFIRQETGSQRSAREVVPWVFDHVRPTSVVDVGCGVGTWLRVFNELGVEDILGLDGEWVDRAALLTPADRFRSVDLKRRVELGRGFDLAVCLEVGEHLPSEAAPRLVQLLTDAAPIVLFSAAIPGQGGTHHINEQWQDYWADLFAQHDFVAIDCIRPEFWENDSVSAHYAQNTLLYAKSDHPLRNQLQASAAPLNIVHPSTLTKARQPTLKYLVRQVPASARRTWGILRRRAKRRRDRGASASPVCE